MAIQLRLRLDWHDLVMCVPAQRTVYLIVDDAQALHANPPASSRSRPPAVFWNLVKEVMSDKAIRVRVRLFAAHGSSLEFAPQPTPIQLNQELSFDMENLNFNHEELIECVEKRFEGFQPLQIAAAQRPTWPRCKCSTLTPAGILDRLCGKSLWTSLDAREPSRCSTASPRPSCTA